MSSEHRILIDFLPNSPAVSSTTRESERDHPIAVARFEHSEAADRALANALPQVIWTCDHSGRLEWVNDRWFELTGLTEEETLNDKGALVAVHPDDRADLARRWGRAVETGSATEIEYRILTVSGEYRWHVGQIAPVRKSNGDVGRWVAAAFDIHDRRVAEDALRVTERKFEAVFDLNPQPLAITRQSDGVFINVNDAFVSLMGFTREETIGKSAVDLGMWRAEDRDAFLAVVQPDHLRSREIPVRTKDGRTIHVVLSNAPIEIDGVPCFVSASPDVTDRRATEDALRQSEAQARARADELAALMDSVPAVVWVTHDRDCNEIHGNKAGYEVLRVPIGQNVSKTAPDPEPTRHFSILVNSDAFPPDELPLHRAARGDELRNFEEEIHFDDGQVTHLYGSAVTLRDPDGVPRGAIGAFVDVTRLKQAEDALRRADRRKDEFLAMLSHELRNPLTPILSAARLLEPRVDPAGRHDLDVIVRQVKHLVRLVDDLLDVSRVARGVVTLSMARLEPATVVARAVEATAPLFEERSHRLEISVPAEGLAVDGDEVRLTQVLDNLFSNAARYTPPGGVVSVTGSREDDSVVLRVRDSGAGIDPALLPDLFDTFVQGVRSPDRAEGGLGIGLSLVRTLTELHGGTVTAYSDGPGHGSEFAVRLPAAPSSERAGDSPISPRSPAAERRAQPARVLLVDDQRDVVDGISRLLTIVGYDVRSARDPYEAIAVARTWRPDVAILDIGLPGMDGYALARELLSRLHDSPPILVALSGYSQASDRHRSSAAGFVVHLVKPIDVDELADVIGMLVAERRAVATVSHPG